MYVVNAYMKLADNFQDSRGKLTVNILKGTTHIIASWQSVYTQM